MAPQHGLWLVVMLNSCAAIAGIRFTHVESPLEVSNPLPKGKQHLGSGINPRPYQESLEQYLSG
jgi:hypothetical protein